MSQIPHEIPLQIRVLKRMYLQEYVDEFWRDRLGDGLPMPECPRLKDDQVFDTTLLEGCPPDFCQWAWGDIFGSLLLIAGQASEAEPGTDKVFDKVVCCSDGWRPVIMHIRALPDRQRPQY
jgi:uncharacterized repeat protein (TIGR04076 family)